LQIRIKILNLQGFKFKLNYFTVQNNIPTLKKLNMAGINKVILLGNIGKDPEIRTFDNGKKKANFSLATSESYRDKEGNKIDKTEWHNIVFWGPVVDVIEKYVKKGKQLYVEGKIATRSFEKDGQTRYITEIEGQNLTLIGSGGGNNENQNNSNNNTSSQNSQDSKEEYVPPVIENQADDDLPF
jgi:single-strand DNA-binding protein